VPLELGHRLEGDGPVLVLLPSLGTTTALWDPQRPPLAERFRLVLVEHPGHGGSPVPTEAFSVEDEARALLTLLDGLGIERFALAGISLGGMVGMTLATLAPERLGPLALCCTGAKLGDPESWRERVRVVRAEGTEAIVEVLRERWFAPEFRHSPAAEACLEQLREVPDDAYARCAEAVGAFDFRGELGRVEAATLVLGGEEDPVASPEVIRALADGIRGSSTALVPGASHLANVERPELVTAALLEHLEAAA
jgi:3-oxoadipate enol-lactonase